ncbi:hypothetical protein ACTJIJ_23055 [Niabella sp. 22666]|uniref:hypothetical protein n=1 Tax=Niabella sp. 22666 TaxID=3453954 RepID=UPI003F84214E
MKKLIVLSVLVALAALNSCHIKRKAQKSSIVVDSVRVIASTNIAKQESKDSFTNHATANIYKYFNELEFTADKIIKREESPVDLKFILNVDGLKVTGDSAKAVDINTGTEATFYRTTSGEMAVNIKPKKGSGKTYELTNVRLKTKQGLDTSKTEQGTSGASTNKAEQSIATKDSTIKKATTTTRQVDVQKDFGLLKTIGLVVVGVLLLRLLVYVFRNAFPWVGAVNKILSFKK